MKRSNWGRPQVTLTRPSPSPRVCTDEGRSYGDVITKFSLLDGLPIFLTNGASLVCFVRWSSATMFYMRYLLFCLHMSICASTLCPRLFRFLHIISPSYLSTTCVVHILYHKVFVSANRFDKFWPPKWITLICCILIVRTAPMLNTSLISVARSLWGKGKRVVITFKTFLS